MIKHLTKFGIIGATCFAALTLTACQNNQQKQQQAQQNHQHVNLNSNSDDLSNNGQYFQNARQRKVESWQKSKALKNINKQLGYDYRKIGYTAVNLKTKTFMLHLQGKQMSQLVKAVNTKNKSALKFWSTLTGGMNKTSKSVSHQLRDPDIKFEITAPHNIKKIMYMTSNGTPSFNQYQIKKK